MMKSFGFWVFMLLVGTALVCLTKTLASTPPNTALNLNKHDIAVTATSKKLKESKLSDDRYTLEDYGPNDPAPSSKASIGPGPIQHKVPVMPYIAPPSPPLPLHPKHY